MAVLKIIPSRAVHVSRTSFPCARAGLGTHMDGLTASMNPAGQRSALSPGAQLSNHQPETGAEWKDAPRSLVFYVARNPSCRLSQAFMRMRCAAALCSAPAVTHPFIRPGVAGNRFRNSVWFVIQKRTINADALTAAQHGDMVDDDDPEHRATPVGLTNSDSSSTPLYTLPSSSCCSRFATSRPTNPL